MGLLHCSVCGSITGLMFTKTGDKKTKRNRGKIRMRGYISLIMWQGDIFHVVDNMHIISCHDSYMNPIIKFCLSTFPSLRDDTDMKVFQ